MNPAKAAIREGAFGNVWPATFSPSQGGDLAGVVEEPCEDVEGFAVATG